jgi:folate-binding protein YgfZ
MNPFWEDHLRKRGVVITDAGVTDFGHPDAELAAAGAGTILCDLSHLGLIRFEGEDRSAFLQGQLTCELRDLKGRATHGGYCSAKGRLLATFLLWPGENAHLMQLPRDVQQSVQQRLAMFVLRAKVRLADVGDEAVRMGVAGPGAEAALAQSLGGGLPARPLSISKADGLTLIRLDASRFELVVPPELAPALWDRLAGAATPAGAACWEWTEIRAGIPSVTAVTREQFVPQMANLDLIGGVSFTKGCYPGQEIVARTHYLGRLKRRMLLAHLAGDAPPRPGDEIHARDTEGQAAGMVVRAAPAPGGGFDLLAVVQVSSAESGELWWKSPQGARLEPLPLPYDVQ